jgi:hypothetical protein
MTGCSKLPTIDHVVMLEVKEIGVLGDPVPGRDSWVSSSWTVYYDGTIEFHETYMFAGDTTTQTWTMPEDAMVKLYEAMEKVKLQSDRPALSDETSWKIVYYDAAGIEISTYEGAMGTDENLKFVRDFLFPQPSMG